MREDGLNETKELEELRRQYKSIPIPEGLEFRVKSSIVRGRNARSGQGGEKTAVKKRRYLKRGLGACAAALLTIAALANSGPGVARAMERIPLLGPITRVFTFRTYQDQRGDRVSADIRVPEVENGGELNDAIQKYTDTIIAEYEQDAAEAAGTEAESHSGRYRMDLDYTVVTDNDVLFSLRFNKTVIMASGAESVRIYNVDKATGKILALGDLFRKDGDYLGALTENIRRQMRARMEEDESVQYWLDGEVEAWNFTALDPDVSFYINGAGKLVIVFDEGVVAPMYMGVTEFAIPAETVAEIAVPGYLK